MKKFTLLSVFIVVSLLLSSCSLHLGLSNLLGGGSKSKKSTPGVTTAKSKGTPAGPISTISIRNGKYQPKNVTVTIGTTLTWTNHDTLAQSVTSDKPGTFDSGPLAPGASWKFTFSQAGTFPYHSTGSTSTFGSVTVTP